MLRSSVSINQAYHHFIKWCIPRRLRDTQTEVAYYNENFQSKIIYRKVTASDRVDRGELYPLLEFQIDALSQFSIGIGIYFVQLIVFVVICYVSSCLLVPMMSSYYLASYDPSKRQFDILSLTAYCHPFDRINVTDNCNEYNNRTCEVNYRPDCQLPSISILMDIIVCLSTLALILASLMIVSEVERVLDVSIQSPQDYSIKVYDPDPDAVNPDEWYDFFSRFGKVCYITVVRENMLLGKLLLKRHLLWLELQKILEFANESSNFAVDQHIMSKSKYKCNPCSPFKQKSYAEEISDKNRKLNELDGNLSKLYSQNYPACKVFVTFDHEEHQRLALRELSVSDFKSLDIQCLCCDVSSKSIQYNKLFRSTNILRIKEAAEPSNIYWANLEVKWVSRSIRHSLSYLVTFGSVVCSYFIIVRVQNMSLFLLPFTIYFLDVILTTVFEYLTWFEALANESLYQKSLYLKLFVLRFLLSTLFPYLSIEWNQFLNADVITQILSIQITAYFLTPLINFVGIDVKINQYIIGPLMHFNDQNKYQIKYWSGIPWNISKNYTLIVKTFFLTIWFMLLVPISFIFAFFGFIIVFFCDYYSLLRLWKQGSMFSNDLSESLIRQVLLAISGHMWISARLIYSWPMDDVYSYYSPNTNSTVFMKVDKYPSALYLNLKPQNWHSESQKAYLFIYQIITSIMIIITVFYWLFKDPLHVLYNFFFKHVKPVGSASNIPFSNASNVYPYVPLIISDIGEEFIFANTIQMLPSHKPSLVRANYDEKNSYEDITIHIPEKYRSKVLSVVKWYDDSGGSIDPSKKFVNADVFGKLDTSINLSDVELGRVNNHDKSLQYLAKSQNRRSTESTLSDYEVDLEPKTVKESRIQQIIGVDEYRKRKTLQLSQTQKESKQVRFVGSLTKRPINSIMPLPLEKSLDNKLTWDSILKDMTSDEMTLTRDSSDVSKKIVSIEYSDDEQSLLRQIRRETAGLMAGSSTSSKLKDNLEQNNTEISFKEFYEKILRSCTKLSLQSSKTETNQKRIRLLLRLIHLKMKSHFEILNKSRRKSSNVYNDFNWIFCVHYWSVGMFESTNKL